MKGEVAIVRCPDYQTGAVYQAVREAVTLCGGLEQLKAFGTKALLKPNLLFGSPPGKAITTHPAVIEAAIRVFQEAGFTVTVGDSPAIDNPVTAARKCGIAGICEKYNVALANFKDTFELVNPDGRMVKRFTVAQAVADCDFVVSLPKLKTHGMMYHTGALKNLYGTIVGLQKSQLHLQFPEKDRFAAMIVDLNTALKPRFAIQDAIVAMEGAGPSNGTPKPIGVIMASTDLVALDTASCEIIGYDPEKMPILAEAYTRGNPAWVTSPAEVLTYGENIPAIRPQSFNKISVVSDTGFIKKMLPPWIFNSIRDAIVPRPVFLHGKCIRCGKCTEICPADALKFVPDRAGRHIVIDYKKCIRCYCCHEVCPADAIALKKVFHLGY